MLSNSYDKFVKSEFTILSHIPCYWCQFLLYDFVKIQTQILVAFFILLSFHFRLMQNQIKMN